MELSTTGPHFFQLKSPLGIDPHGDHPSSYELLGDD
jgi:hypothetical protein